MMGNIMALSNLHGLRSRGNGIIGTSPTHQLIGSIQLEFHHASHPNRTNRRPNALLTPLDPVPHALLGWVVQQPPEIARRQVRYDQQRRSGYVFVQKESPHRGGHQTQRIELREAVLHLQHEETGKPERRTPSSVAAGIGSVEVGSEKWYQVRSGLGYDEMIHVEQLAHAHKRRVAVGVASGRRRSEGAIVDVPPRYNLAFPVFA
jgi:hypothetical protein